MMKNDVRVDLKYEVKKISLSTNILYSSFKFSRRSRMFIVCCFLVMLLNSPMEQLSAFLFLIVELNIENCALLVIDFLRNHLDIQSIVKDFVLLVSLDWSDKY
jgi:hypothetical protein